MRAREIIIGESCIFGVEASAAFRETGLEEVAREKNVSLLDLDRLDPLDIRILQWKASQKDQSLLHREESRPHCLGTGHENPHAYPSHAWDQKHEGAPLEKREGEIPSSRGEPGGRQRQKKNWMWPSPRWLRGLLRIWL